MQSKMYLPTDPKNVPEYSNLSEIDTELVQSAILVPMVARRV